MENMKEMTLTVDINMDAADAELIDPETFLDSLDLEALFIQALANAICTDEEKQADDFPHLPAGFTSQVEFADAASSDLGYGEDVTGIFGIKQPGRQGGRRSRRRSF